LQGQQYLGSFVGIEECKDAWLTNSCNKWAAAVGTLAKLADRWPQTAYAGLNFVLQNQWQYVKRVVLDTGAFFEPVEQALRQEFIPALMGLPKEEITGHFHELLSQSVKKGGIGIRNPVDHANHELATLLEAASYLVMSMIGTGEQFSVTTHNCNVSRARAEACKMRLEREQDYLSHGAEGKRAEKRSMEHVGRVDAVFTAVPNRQNGTVLSAGEFRDNIRLRYNYVPLEMTQLCDGCGAKMTVEHALSCRVGGQVHICHDDVADEFGALCTTAFSPGRFQCQP
jgi:hypothetical protein